jgi:hypothetical protein
MSTLKACLLPGVLPLQSRLHYVTIQVYFSCAASGGGVEEYSGDPLLHPPDARPRTPPRGLQGPLEPPAVSY